ncbi:MAG: LysR family transcriptional regulator [Promethearchaeota archaeon]
MIRIFDLKLFVILIKEKSFSKTAKRMGKTQSSITQSIQKMEADLDIKLISRSSKFFTLTPAGRIFLQMCEDILEIFDSKIQEIKLLKDEEQNKVHLAVSTTPGEFLLPPFLSEFSSRNAPDVRVIVEMGDSKKAIELLKDGGCQVAIVGSLMGADAEAFEKIPLVKEKLVFIVSKDVPTGKDGTLPLDSLANLTRIERETGSGTQEESKAFVEAIVSMAEAASGRIAPRPVQLQSVQAILSAISDGSGLWSVVGYYAARKFAEHGLIKIVNWGGEIAMPSRIIYLLYKKHEVSDITHFFIENIKKYYEMQTLFTRIAGGSPIL